MHEQVEKIASFISLLLLVSGLEYVPVSKSKTLVSLVSLCLSVIDDALTPS